MSKLNKILILFTAFSIMLIPYSHAYLFPDKADRQGVFETKNSYEFTFDSKKSLQVGEELTYVVSYSLIKLGEVKLKIKSKKEENGKTLYSASAYIDSYSSVPFVNLHQIYETIMTPDYYSDYFRGLVKEEKYTTYTEYNFDYDKSKIAIKKGKIKPPQIWTDSSASAEKKYQDGLSIFYFARMNFGEKKSINLPCFVNEEKVSTKINYYTNVTDVSIDAVDYDIACLKLDGETNFVSVYGLTGYFEGWFSNDEASIPIVAKMKVIIGNVTLELTNWKRKGWNPPKFN